MTELEREERALGVAPVDDGAGLPNQSPLQLFVLWSMTVGFFPSTSILVGSRIFIQQVWPQCLLPYWKMALQHKNLSRLNWPSALWCLKCWI
ncbi:unnamed protein product [Caretta caretta]